MPTSTLTEVFRETFAARGFPERYAKRPGKGQGALFGETEQQSFDWDEKKHPRDSDGKFAEKEGGETKKPLTPTAARRQLIAGLFSKYMPAEAAAEAARSLGPSIEHRWMFSGALQKSGMEKDAAEKAAVDIMREIHSHYTQQKREPAIHEDIVLSEGELSEKRKSASERWKEERDAKRAEAIEFAKARYKDPPFAFRTTPDQWAAIQVYRKLDEVEKDAKKLADLHKRYEEATDRASSAYYEPGAQEARKAIIDEMDKPSTRRLMQKYPYSWNAEKAAIKRGKGRHPVSIYEAVEVSKNEVINLKERINSKMLTWYASDKGWNPTREHAEAVKHAAEQGTPLDDEVIEAYAYEDWMPQKYRQQLDGKRKVKEWKEYATGKYQKFHAEDLAAAMEAAKPDLDALFEKANASLKTRDTTKVSKTEKARMDAAMELAEAATQRAEAAKSGVKGEEYEKIKQRQKAAVEKSKAADKAAEDAVREVGQKWLASLLPKETADIEIAYSPHQTEEGRQHVDEAVAWLKTVVSAKHGKLRYKVEDLSAQASNLKTGKRANASNGGMRLDEKEATYVVVHEFGHLLDEEAGNELGLMGKVFAVEQIKKHKGQIEHLGPGYEPDEYAHKDGFLRAYAGKYYGHSASEVLSMGLQHLYEDPIKFFQDSPEHFRYTMAAVHGWLT